MKGLTKMDEIKKMKAWLESMIEVCDDAMLPDDHGDQVGPPCTPEGFIECFKEHVKGHTDDSNWTDEFCPFCDDIFEAKK